jgi:group I intron endonuclease
VDLSTRWKDHIKAGLGIDTPSNILYKAMAADGVENFSFEVLEECDRSELNNRETYWIDFYNTTIFGYNMTKGGAKKQ